MSDGLGDFGRLRDDERPPAKPFWKHPIAIILVVIAASLGVQSLVDDDPGTLASDEGNGEASNVSSRDEAAGEQFEWSITVGDGLVMLRGDKPNGYPSETWADGQLLDRDEGGDFAWDTQAELPLPVSLINAMSSCDELSGEFDLWLSGSDSAPSQDSAIRQLAFAQAALNRAASLGCA